MAVRAHGLSPGTETSRDNQWKEFSLNQYEIAVLYHPDLEVDLSKAEDKVKKIVADNGGKVNATDNWGKRCGILQPIIRN